MTDNLPPSCAVVTKFGNLNFLEPSGPLRTCNGAALPLLAAAVVLEVVTIVSAEIVVVVAVAVVVTVV